MREPNPRDAAVREHQNLAAKVQRLKRPVAELVTDQFLTCHPDWLLRYGERARVHGIEDACYHLDFLSGALASGSIASFEHYAQWVSRVLQSRGIDPRFVVENLDQLEAALRPHLTAEEGAVITSVLSAGREACSPTLEPPHELDSSAGLHAAQQLFLQTALTGRRKEALQIVLEALRAGQAITDIYVEIIQASLYEVGRLWETNRISVAEEHMVTVIIQCVIAQVYAEITPAATSRGNIVITGIQGELHQVGANLVADVLEADGWSVCFLGTNMPPTDILQAIETNRADILGISATMLFSLPHVKELIASVRSRYGAHSPRIVLGGGAFRQLPYLAAEIGADGSATDVRDVSALMQAVIEARPMV